MGEAFYGETPDALDPGVSAVFHALDGYDLLESVKVLESSLAAARAACEVWLALPGAAFPTVELGTARN